MVGEKAPVSLPWLSQPRRVIGFIAAFAVIAAVAFVAGLLIRSPVSSALDAADEIVPVYALVEQRQVDSGLVIQGLVVDSQRLDIAPPAVDGADRLVVTAMTSALGEAVASGKLLATVSGRPLIALALSIPLYRDINSGDSGPDVTSLQHSLGVPETGKFDKATSRAFRSLYSAVGQSVPGGNQSTYVESSEIVSFDPSGSGWIVVETASVGEVLDDKNPLLTVSTGSPSVSVRANVAEAETLVPGSELNIRLSGATVDGVVQSVGPFQEAVQGESGATIPAGFDVTIVFGADVDMSLVHSGDRVTVTSGAPVAPSLAVPLIAIRQDDEGAYVLRGSRENDVTEVRVEVIRVSGGWAAVESDGLTAGDSVRTDP